jgi:transposase
MQGKIGEEMKMSLSRPHSFDIPEETVRVARDAFPKGNAYMTMRDELGPLFGDDDFVALFSPQGQAGESPAILAIVIVLQYMEGLTDRQAAEAVRSRIDWKYLLGLSLTDPGFHYSILSPFRDRLLKGGWESLLLDRIVERLKERGLLKDKRQQRTDSTHVLAAVRNLNRLECVGETMRRVLDDLARVSPDWLLKQITPDWFDRYGKRFEAYRLPKEKTKREALQMQIGQDGSHLLGAIYSEDAPPWLREIPSVEVMCRVWVQQYYTQGEQVRWRDNKELPPHKLLIVSPDDIEARNRTKRETNWTGYVVHLTETCSQATPNIITHVETTPATTTDGAVVDTIHRALADKDLLPEEHLADTAYVSVDNLLGAQQKHNVDIVGPVVGGSSWQAKAGKGFDISCFAIDWENQTVMCPQGRQSQSWRIRREKYGHEYIAARFDPADCRACPHRPDCTRSRRGVRTVTFKPQVEYETLQAARERQETEAFKQKYKKRAGVEGTISQGTRAFDLRRSRYLGLAKTHLQHLATAAAMNLTRVVSWLAVEDESKTSPYRSPFTALAPT